MFKSASKKMLPWRSAFSFPLNQQHRGLLQFRHLTTVSKTPKSDTLEDGGNRLFVTNCLTQTHGMAQEKAESPDSVVSFFINQGFSGTQIKNLIVNYPCITGMDPDKSLLPKFEFFRSLGLSNKDISLMLGSKSCHILGRSLEKQIMPLYTYLSTLLESHEKTLVCIKRFCLILSVDLENVLIPNVEYLSEVGVPRANVVGFVRTYPLAFSYKHDRFRKAVDDIVSMGFDPMRANFGASVFAYGWNKESSWGEKMGAYKSVGLCDADITEAFRMHPYCMTHSADKILKTMDFLVNKMGFEPSFVMKWPAVLSYSLEKRIVPRCTVYQALLAKDLVPKKFTLRLLLECHETKFLSTFVEPFEAQVPGLLLMYKNSCPASK